MNQIEREEKQWREAGFYPLITDAPPKSIQFDKMLVIFSDPSKKKIKKVSFFNSTTGRFIAHF